MNAAAVRQPQPDPATAATILIVEDDVLVRIAAANYLRGCGFAVLEAVDADQAEALLRSAPSIRAVFSDVKLPGPRSGLDLTLLIEQDYPDMKVLLTSGIVRAEEAGIVNAPLIRKPYFLFEVERRIKAFLAE